MTNTNSPIETYESLYARLQTIVAALEAGELPLEQALALYEEGVAAAASCQRILDAAELRVRELHGAAGREGQEE